MSKYSVLRTPCSALAMLLIPIVAGCSRTTSHSSSEERSFADQFCAIMVGQSDEINLSSVALTDDDISLLKSATALRVLILDHPKTNITAVGIRQIQALPNLHHLRIRGTGADDEALQEIAAIKSLRILNLPQGDFTDAGLERLKELAHLESFRFGSSRVSDAGINVLATMPALSRLHLIDVPITDAGLAELAKMTQLESLYIDGAEFSDAAIDELFRARPHLHVHFNQEHHDRDPHKLSKPRPVVAVNHVTATTGRGFGMPVTLDDIRAAKDRIAGAVAVSPCPESPALSDLTGSRVFCKLDALQRTGSFKERGARNALSLLNSEQRRRGVIAASAGNHALALACHGREMGIPVTVVMPRFAPLIKVATCRRFSAAVVLHGDNFADARTKADDLAAESGLTYIHGFDDQAVIAGQGTIGLELLDQVPGLEAVIVPVGGGGLIAGVSLAIKSLRPDVQIIGVEAAAMPNLTPALAAGHVVVCPPRPTLADGLATTRLGDNAFAILRERIDRAITVSEELIALSILRLIELEKSVIEGAAAAPLAALLSGQLPELRGKTVALLLCGGNIDPLILGRVIDVGLAADGRLARLVATISDRPGGLAHLASLIAQAGASVQQITHDRVYSGPDVSSVRVVCDIETHDRQHLEQLLRQLRDKGIESRLQT